MRLVETIQAPWVGKSEEDYNRMLFGDLDDWWDSDASYNDRPLGWDEPDGEGEAEEQKGDMPNA